MQRNGATSFTGVIKGRSLTTNGNLSMKPPTRLRRQSGGFYFEALPTTEALTLPMAKARGFLLHRGLPRLRMQP